MLVSGVVFAEENQMPPMHHLVEVKPSEQISIPDEFELDDRGQISCKTCHGLKDIKKTPLDKVDRKADNFFNGGPYPRLIDFCHRCHDKKAYARPNIHQLLDDKGEHDKKACEYCHLEAPDPEKTADQQEIKLRLPVGILCYGCHLKTPHLNALNHQVKPDEEMVKLIKSSEEELVVILPLDKEGRVTCVTCHSPHQAGLIDQAKPAGRQIEDTTLKEGVSYQPHPWSAVFAEDKKDRLKELTEESSHSFSLEYQRLKTEVLLRLSAKDGALCLACHTFKD
ncbi:MAG: hypothetical protein L3J28_11245 [Candidatus Polarisedimenticolaceae bacterium]|nr:hypothetical protein [Candidatus Polarisedimenticolaceae bacterium]